ncbi:Rne/Rng family ribonuclease [Candidatus Binatia bacterium]|nr:Rne/Rng family ribonuclease [Candidatus Binatia bacterium]
MAREIVINAAPFETRVALLEKQRLVEIFIERSHDRGIAGNIYKGIVTRVLPGMQAAFVDIGLEKAAFLHGSDLLIDIGDEFIADDGGTPIDVLTDENAHDTRTAQRRVPIEDRLRKGQEILVQVAKPPLGTKGARVTSLISLPGRYLVYTPSSAHIGVSRRIEDETERARLKDLVLGERPPEGGFIIRTACEGLSRREIQGDIKFLQKLWNRISSRSERAGAPTVLHADMDLVLRTVRDLFTTDTQRLVVDSEHEHQRILEFVDTVMPRLKNRIEYDDVAEPIFDRYGIETQINRALERKVWLKSGGYIVIDHTEALTVVDVNTGRYVGKQNQEETILKTNLEAVRVIVEQVRLRNIGGLIVIDFIDMEEAASQNLVVEALQEALKRDKARSKLLPLSELGLIEMTRKRARESLVQVLCAPCATCEGRGHVKATATIAYEVLRRIQREGALNASVAQITVHVHPAVADFLRRNEEQSLQMLETRLDKKIAVKVSPDMSEDRYEVTAVEAAA